MSARTNQPTQPKKRSFRPLLTLIALLLALIAAIAGLLAWLDVQLPFTEPENDLDNGVIYDSEAAYEELEDENPDVTYDARTGQAFINNRIVVIMKSGYEDDIEWIAQDLGADIDDSMGDIGIFRLALPDHCSHSELEQIAEQVLSYESVENAYIDPVMLMSSNDEETVELCVESVTPDDPWNDASWSTDVPRDENWCAEAVYAPEAWAHLDELENVTIGQIDTAPNTSHPDLDDVDITTYSMEIRSGKVTVSDVGGFDDKTASHHGTHVAGTMVAEWDNGEGISGMTGGKADLLFCYPTSGFYSSSEFAQMIKELSDRGARVINLSMGYGDNTLIYGASHGNEAAIDAVRAEAEVSDAILERVIDDGGDFLVCVSAGNSNDTYLVEDDSATYGYRLPSDWFPWEDLGIGSEKGDVDTRYNTALAFSTNETVKSRVIVVGATGIDKSHSSKSETRYSYADFSDGGSRVDIAAPGVDVFSTGGASWFGLKKETTGYHNLSGTSMSAPIVTSAVALAFAANPDLTGPQAKKVVCASTSGRYYYTGGSCGMVNLHAVVEYALATKDNSISDVIGSSDGALDLCFVVDTTSSMGDDIANAQQNMRDILSGLGSKTSDYRVALVDYRDFPERTSSQDYAARTQLEFTEDNAAITDAINALSLGDGGDSPETVYSGIVQALNLDWRDGAKKVIIILGDAEPLDPEPNTDYTYGDIVAMLYSAGVAIDTDSSDDRVLGSGEDSLINVYTVGIGSSANAIEFFENIATDTGGTFSNVEDAEEVAGAINDSIEAIEIEDAERPIKFGEAHAGETVELYGEDGAFVAQLPLDDEGEVDVGTLPSGSYTWEIERLGRAGELALGEPDEGAEVTVTEKQWYDVPMRLYQQHKPVVWCVVGALVALLVVTLLVRRFMKRMAAWNRRRAAAAEMRHQRKSQEAAARAAAARAAYDARMAANSARPTALKFCPHCGKTLDGRSGGFCPHCGHKIR